MKIKNITVGLIVAGFFLTLIALVVYTPASTPAVAEACEANPIQCVVPQNLSAAYFPLQNW